MVKQHRRLNGIELEHWPGDRGGQRSLVGCSPCGHRVRKDLASERQKQQQSGQEGGSEAGTQNSMGQGLEAGES